MSEILFLELSEQNSRSLGSPATSIDMMERRNFPSRDQAIGKYTTRDDNDLKGSCSFIWAFRQESQVVFDIKIRCR